MPWYIRALVRVLHVAGKSIETRIAKCFTLDLGFLARYKDINWFWSYHNNTFNCTLNLEISDCRKGYLCACGGARMHPHGRSPRGLVTWNAFKYCIFHVLRLEIATRFYCTAFWHAEKVFQNTSVSVQLAQPREFLTTYICKVLHQTSASSRLSKRDPQLPQTFSSTLSILNLLLNMLISNDI